MGSGGLSLSAWQRTACVQTGTTQCEAHASQPPQVRALKPGAVGLGMGGVAPGEILPAEEHVLSITAEHAEKPLLLTDCEDDGAADVQAVEVLAQSTSADEAAGQIMCTGGTDAAPAAASSSKT